MCELLKVKIFSLHSNDLVADFNGVVLVQNYLSRTGRDEWAKQVNPLLFSLALSIVSFSLTLLGLKFAQDILVVHRLMSLFNVHVMKQFREAAKENDDCTMFKIMSNYGMYLL